MSSSATYSAYIIVVIAGFPSGSAAAVSFTELRLFGPSNPTYSKYHSIAVNVAMGFYTPIAPPSAANLLAGDFQTYGTDISPYNGIASSYFGGNCTSFNSSLSTNLALGGPAHRYIAGVSSGASVSPLSVADVADIIGSYEGIYTTFVWSGQGGGVGLTNGAYAKLGDSSDSPFIDWGYGAQSGSGFSMAFWVYRTAAATASGVTTQLAQFVATSGSSNKLVGFSVAIRSNTTAIGNALYVSWPGCGTTSPSSPGAVYIRNVSYST